MSNEKMLEIDIAVSKVLGYEPKNDDPLEKDLIRVETIRECEGCSFASEDIEDLTPQEIDERYPLKWGHYNSLDRFVCESFKQEIIDYLLSYYGGYNQKIVYDQEKTYIEFSSCGFSAKYEYDHYFYPYLLGNFLIDLENKISTRN